MPLIRLQKFLSTAGFCSRRRGEELIRQGRVSVNGETVTQLGSKVAPDADRIAVDGFEISCRPQAVYIALNKPEGYVTSCDHPGEKTVVDLVAVAQRVYPVGRLDKDSSGLILLTNDGRLHHRLSHPSFDHEKEYEVTVAKPMAIQALDKLAAGLPLMGTRTRPADVRRLSDRRFRIVLKEGRNRQIRRMVSKVGNRVVKLKRIRVASIRLGRLEKGRWRHLSEIEIKSLHELTKD
ncbi:MAG: pseudouridine synthase [Deltaproteobacteria bacterium]|nr:pseudouridine synthase [Deltaproteobacteria bacterium]